MKAHPDLLKYAAFVCHLGGRVQLGSGRKFVTLHFGPKVSVGQVASGWLVYNGYATFGTRRKDENVFPTVLQAITFAASLLDLNESITGITRAYLATALEIGMGDDDVRGMTVDDFSPDSEEETRRSIRAWVLNNYQMFRWALDRVGVDAMGRLLYLTRNGHGTGFWDEGLLKCDDEDAIRDMLNESCENKEDAEVCIYGGHAYLLPSRFV